MVTNVNTVYPMLTNANVCLKNLSKVNKILE